MKFNSVTKYKFYQKKSLFIKQKGIFTYFFFNHKKVFRLIY